MTPSPPNADACQEPKGSRADCLLVRGTQDVSPVILIFSLSLSPPPPLLPLVSKGVEQFLVVLSH